VTGGAGYAVAKRLVDLLASIAALIVTLPIQLVVAALILVRMGHPVLFRQERPGKDGRVFELVKFRTMLAVDDAAGRITDEQRLTRLGRFLRSASLDELPTFVNVLRGDMSLVGPRPLLVDYLPRYSPRQARRHEVRPGITGLAQASGRNLLSWDEKLEMDVEYVERCSLWFDLSILVKTVLAVVRREGINAEGHVTMAEFHGAARGAVDAG